MSARILFIFLLFAVASPAIAQNACEITLTKAQEEFDAGRFHGVPAMLEECIRRGQNREWEQRAYLLLAETYLLLEDPVKADESYLKVLTANPEFVTDETRDPIDLVYLSKKFTATPIFSLTARAGLNTSVIRVIHDVDMPGQLDLGPESYSMKAGWQAALGLDYNYSPTISFSIEGQYSFATYVHSERRMFEDVRQDFTDRQSWINFPVTVKYTHGVKNLRPFVIAGLSPGFLVRDRANLVIDGDSESEFFNFMSKRNTFSPSYVAGVGLKYKWGLRYLFGEVRYTLGMKNLADAVTRYEDPNFPNQQWPYVDNDFRMDNLYVSVGYVHPFYKARKLKNARTKSVLRKTRRANETKD